MQVLFMFLRYKFAKFELFRICVVIPPTMPREEWCRRFIGFSGVVYQVPSLGQVPISGQAGFAVGGHEEHFT